MPKASKYNRRIEIWGKEQYQNEFFETDYRDAKLKTIWAGIIPQTGKLQTQQAETVLSNTSHKIVVRYSAGKSVKEDNWIIFKGQRYNILYLLNPFESDEEIEIFCEKVVG